MYGKSKSPQHVQKRTFGLLAGLATGILTTLSFLPATVDAQLFSQQATSGGNQANGLPVYQQRVAGAGGQRTGSAIGASGIRNFYSEQQNTSPPPVANTHTQSQDELTIYQPYPVPYGNAAVQTQVVQQPRPQIRYVQRPQQVIRPQIRYIQKPVYIQAPQPQPQIRYVQQPPQRIRVPVPVPVPYPVPAPQPAPAPQPVAAPQLAPQPAPVYHAPAAPSGDIINNNYNTIDIQVPQARAAAQPVYYQAAPQTIVAAPAPAPRQTYSAPKGCGYVKATDSLNLRTGPDVWNKKVCTVPKGYRMKCGGCKGKWCKVKFRGRYLWASKNFLTSAR